jgi:hypothetical protein
VHREPVNGSSPLTLDVRHGAGEGRFPDFPAMFRRGIAKRLMIDAMRHLQREGMEEAQLRVDETNVTNAVKLHERLGFAAPPPLNAAYPPVGRKL